MISYNAAVAELEPERMKVAREVCEAFGTGNPTHRELQRDVENAYLIALASPAFRALVERSSLK